MKFVLTKLIIIEVRIDKMKNHRLKYSPLYWIWWGDADNENEAVDDVDDENQAVDDVDDENDTIPARINLYMMYPKNIKNKEPK